MLDAPWHYLPVGNMAERVSRHPHPSHVDRPWEHTARYVRHIGPPTTATIA